MKLWIGLVLLAAGGILALIGYAPILSPFATSLELIGIGGLLITAGTFVTLIVCAKRFDARDVDDSWRIRPY